MSNRILKAVLLATVVTGLAYAGGSREAGGPVGNPDAARRVLIAAEYTRFKEALVEELVKQLNDGNTYIKVIDHSKDELNGVDPREWSSVLITNSGARAQVRPHVVSWLESVRAYDDNVVLHTTQINDWTPQVQVDSVTSASSMGDLQQIADSLLERVRRHL